MTTIERPPQQIDFETPVDAQRELKLRALLGTDYEFAEQSGLIDMFYYDSETGRDGLMHALVGEQLESDTGEKMVQGFHHETSVAVLDEAGISDGLTHVDRSHLDGANSRARSEFAERPFEPYKARVVINGKPKKTWHIDPQTNEPTIINTKNVMYPKEYDSLAVLKTIEAAYGSRDVTSEKRVASSHGEVIEVYGEAPLIDAHASITLRMILDPDTEKIISAYPVPTPESRMRLTNEQAGEHLMTHEVTTATDSQARTL